jgi:predicted nuclease of predicted toxin-antitoxin system
MKIFVDENIPFMTVHALREMGHDVIDVRGTTEEGSPDEALWQMVKKQGRLLITTDKGFTQHREESHHGILIVRLQCLSHASHACGHDLTSRLKLGFRLKLTFLNKERL